MTEIDHTAQVFKALSDPNRITILLILLKNSQYAAMLLEELQIEQPTLSHHMKTLIDADLVVSSKVGRFTYYSINPKGFEYASKFLSSFIK